MSDYTEVTAENLRFLRGAKGINQDAIAEILGIPNNAVSKIEKGVRALSTPETALLNLYFFGKMPFEIVNERPLQSVLTFTDLQWKVIGILARKRGWTEAKWIGDQIRTILSWDEEARATAKALSPEFPALASLEKVAQTPNEPSVTHRQESVTYPQKRGQSK